ncbi:hypothetical protein [Micromonospora sp. NBC_01813]|uniref:hypothetical protein n=1 Tax=Micromonospora sp. NBC_01813 TaxID=2975988 RepID=UPI002DD898E4|nr:hypothetical protein [Micromonospora sp. NBC_01813]WSA07522.1 hypothetical protein OG958_25225 [Micromonospora sp. NBC_01813]
MTAPPTAARFVLRTPESWRSYDLTGAALDAAHQADRAGVTDPVELERLDDAHRQIAELLRSFVRQGALCAAGSVEPFEDGLLMTFLAVFGLALPARADNSVGALAAALGPAGSPRQVSVVEIPDTGSAVRVVGTERVALVDGGTVDMLAMNTVIAVPDTPEQQLLVSAMSPNLPHAAQLYELFDAITATFRFVPAAPARP